MHWWVFDPRRRLALPVVMPRLTIGEAIDRGWHLDGRLLRPNPDEYLTTHPYFYSHRIVIPRINT